MSELNFHNARLRYYDSSDFAYPVCMRLLLQDRYRPIRLDLRGAHRLRPRDAFIHLPQVCIQLSPCRDGVATFVDVVL